MFIVLTRTNDTKIIIAKSAITTVEDLSDHRIVRVHTTDAPTTGKLARSEDAAYSYYEDLMITVKETIDVIFKKLHSIHH